VRAAQTAHGDARDVQGAAQARRPAPEAVAGEPREQFVEPQLLLTALLAASDLDALERPR
jgi:hypothetical protein